MTNEAITNLESDDSNFVTRKIALASLLAFECGIAQIILGVFRAGVLANMFSHSVIVGFTGAAALIIGKCDFFFL